MSQVPQTLVINHIEESVFVRTEYGGNFTIIASGTGKETYKRE